MDLRKILLPVSCITIALVTTIFLQGNEWLTRELSSLWPIPFGNLLAWFALLAWILLPITVAPKKTWERRWFRRVSYVLFILGLLWPFFGWVFAGNWALVFGPTPDFRGSSAAFDWIVAYTAVIFILPILLLLAQGFWALWLWINRTRRGLKKG